MYVKLYFRGNNLDILPIPAIDNTVSAQRKPLVVRRRGRLRKNTLPLVIIEADLFSNKDTSIYNTY
jgi:hypothetical protein